MRRRRPRPTSDCSTDSPSAGDPLRPGGDNDRMVPAAVNVPEPARRPPASSSLMGILRAERAGLSQQAILTELRRAILSGDVAPGTAVPMDEVAELFGVSRIPIREALKTLIGEGLVDRAMREQDYRAYQRESRHFHEALAASCRMPRLIHMIELVWNITEPIQPMAHIRQRDRDDLHGEHREMLEAFLARDRSRLLAITRRHMDELESTVSDLSATGLFDPPGGPAAGPP